MCCQNGEFVDSLSERAVPVVLGQVDAVQSELWRVWKQEKREDEVKEMRSCPSRVSTFYTITPAHPVSGAVL